MPKCQCTMKIQQSNTIAFSASHSNTLIFNKIHTAESLLHLGACKWASWSLNSPATHMFVQQPAQVNIKEKINASYHWLFVSGIHQMTGGFPSQRASTAESVSMSSYHRGSWTSYAVSFVSSKSKNHSGYGLIQHYSDVIMGAMASQITSLMIIYSTIYSGTDQRKHQISVSLAFVRGIHRWPVNSPHKGPVMWKMFPFDDIIMNERWHYSVMPPLIGQAHTQIDRWKSYLRSTFTVAVLYAKSCDIVPLFHETEMYKKS